MTSLIINMPHLQSRRQRHGAMLLSLLCWAWFLMPLVIVGGWLMGFRVLAQEVVWLGGWQSLLHLAELAGTMIVCLTGGWIVWTLVAVARSSDSTAPVAPAIDASKALGADAAEVAAAMGARLATVHFNTDGSVARITAGADGSLARIDQGRPRRAA